MVSVSVSIDQAAVARLDSLMQRVATETPKRLGKELQRAGIYICKAFKSRTKIAPKKIRPSEYRAEPSIEAPVYLTKAGRLLHRWNLTRKVGTPAENTHAYYVYSDAHRGKGGKMVGANKAAEKRELLRLHGQILRRGLARKSWGWVAQGIYGGRASGMGDLSWKRRARDRRDPRDWVRGIFANHGTAASVQLLNKLDYALDALPPAAVNEGITAAVKRLEYNIAADLKRMGV